MAEFPGGLDSLNSYLQRNLHYPNAPLPWPGLKGKVFVSFTVLRTGQIAHAHVERGVNPKLDAEALRVVRAMPAWKPGEQFGQPVAIVYTLPITFLLDADTTGSQ
ncbi:energy transducer TonB [Hymenobacter sp. CRA2]|uniref:energy transducer TonB n=1 Tax=Hymenobacter sp. CRA2 TaxID=1955620 RepID=UPI00158FEA9D|nr:TonB family protein [Hymenobacter sp. CRA2]